MAQTIAGTEDTISGLRVVATRKGVPWPLPPDLAAQSSDTNTLGVGLAGDELIVSRVGSASGEADALVTGGGLSTSLHVTVEPGTPDALSIDESSAVHA